MRYIPAKQLFLSNNRFDLIFKYLYLQNKDRNSDFFSKMYLENIRAFNNFHEDEPSDGIPKESAEDFLNSFNALINKIQENGFDSSHIIPVGKNGEISDGAHRLTCAAFFNLDIPLEDNDRNDVFDYKFFMERGFNPQYADYGAIEYVKLQPNSFIVNLHAVVEEKYDAIVENILKKYGRIYYKKKVPLNFNGYVNLKKLSYGSFWEKEQWIGTLENAFAGAQEHAKRSMGKGKYLRAYVYVCPNPDDLINVKKEVRELFNIGNYCIHINDCREEAIALSELFFNDNSIQIFNTRPFNFEDSEYDSIIEEFKNRITADRLNIEDFVIGGSSPLNVLGARKSDDVDFLYGGEKSFNGEDNIISSHDSELRYYPDKKENIIYDNCYYFYYHGFKIISLTTLLALKKCRNEKPKDVRDCKTIMRILKNKKVVHPKEKSNKKKDFKSSLIYRGLRKLYRITLKKLINKECKIKKSEIASFSIGETMTEKQYSEYMLTIIMSNYNQEQFIKQAVDSVLMQNVNFKYRLIITDDFSQNDKSVEIIKDYAKNYPQIIQPLFNSENGGYLKNILRAKSLTKTPYFCLLDADDYYTDSGFLQRAFDFLEKNKDFVIYYENVDCLYEDGSKKPFISDDTKGGEFCLNDYFNDKVPIVQTTGQFYRNVIFFKGIPQIMQDAVGTESERSFEGDFDRFVMHLKYGKAYFNNRICGVYRILSSGIWTKLSDCQKLLIQLQCYYDYDRYFANKYSEFFINKMYNELLKILKMEQNLNFLDCSDSELLRYKNLYDFMVSHKELVDFKTDETNNVISLHERCIHKIKNTIHKWGGVRYNLSSYAYKNRRPYPILTRASVHREVMDA